MKFSGKTKTYKYILQIALPAIAGLSTQMVVSLVDTAMVGRIPHAEYSLAAMGIGVLATWAIVAFFSSLATGTHVLTARRFGGGEFKACGEVLNTSLILSVGIGGTVGLMVIYFAFDISDLLAADDKVGLLAGEYLYYRFMGIPFFLITVTYRGFFFGISKTKIFMYSGILANVQNIIYNYIFIFGAFGMEPMGLAGAGLGSTIATINDVFFYLIILFLPRYKDKFKYFKRLGFNRKFASSILKISLPVSFQNVFLLVGFLSFVAISGLIGISEQAASQAVISSLFITIMPCMGFGIAVQTLVGNNIGFGKLNLAKYYGFETGKLATLYTLIVGAVFVGAPRIILSLITDDSGVIETAVPALRIAGIGQVFYATSAVMSNGLQAAGKTFFVMMTEIIVNWMMFVPLAWFLGVYLGLGLTGAWAAIPFYVFVFSMVVLIKYSVMDWKKLKKL